jgi:dimethylargininase
MKYKYAIVREPGVSYDSCLSDHPLKKYINIGQARNQHKVYCQSLEELGLKLIQLPREDKLPDSCFVEDTVVIHKDKAFITRIGAESRRGEEDEVIKVLKDKFNVGAASAPATIDGGDVIHLEDSLICGISQRTNVDGARQMQTFLDVHVETIPIPDFMHLKSHVTYLGKNTVAVAEKFANVPQLKQFEKVIIPRTESYAVNTLTINNVTLMPSKYPKSIEIMEQAGFKVKVIDVSEFTKCDGALTCLSILF